MEFSCRGDILVPDYRSSNVKAERSRLISLERLPGDLSLCCLISEGNVERLRAAWPCRVDTRLTQLKLEAERFVELRTLDGYNLVKRVAWPGNRTVD